MGQRQTAHGPWLIVMALSLCACEPFHAQNLSIQGLASSRQCEISKPLIEEVERPLRFSAVREESSLLRSRFGRIRSEQILALAHSGGRNLKLNLFENREVIVEIDSVDVISPTNVVVTGMTDGRGRATIVVNDGIVAAHVNEDGESFEIRSAAGDIHEIAEHDTQVDGVCSTDDDTHPSEGPAEHAFMQHKFSAVGDATIQAESTIDLMVAYTPSALRAAGSVAALEASIQGAVADTETSFKNSRIGHHVRLVAIVPVNQDETTSFDQSLTALTSKSDGKWDEIHQLRAKHGADQVTLVVGSSSGSIAGVGWIGGGEAQAFTVVLFQSIRQYTFAHELGHNLGLNHSDGLESAAGRFRTIMAYGTQKRIPYFSNPEITYNGVPTGDATHNEAALANIGAPRVAAFNTAVYANAPQPTATPVPTPVATPRSAASPIPTTQPAAAPVPVGVDPTQQSDETDLVPGFPCP